jgi:protein-S-isoprenylcysteine O-methyltransferase Ste14
METAFMELHEKLIQEGNWLFRWRSYLPLVMIGLFIAAMNDYSYLGQSEPLNNLWKLFCLLISFSGLFIRVFTVGFTPRGTSGRNTKGQKAESLNTTGMYAIVRNPLYVGNFMMWFGIAIFAHLWWLALIYVLAYFLYYERIVFAEESFLKEKFGDQFTVWANKTPGFIPNFRNWEHPSLAFSLKNVLKREYNGFFAIIIILFALGIIGDFRVKQRLEIDTLWLFLLLFGATVWTVLRLLKKLKVLDVKGR